MLSRVHVRHLALQHSPIREQRLAWFASTPTHSGASTAGPDTNERNDVAVERTQEKPTQNANIRVNQQRVRDTLFGRAIQEVNPANPDEVERLFGQYGDRIHEIAGEVPHDEGNVRALVDLVRERIGQDIETLKPFFRDLAHLETDPDIDPEDTAAIRKHEDDLRFFCEGHRDLIDQYLHIDASVPVNPHQIVNTLQGIFHLDVNTIRASERVPPGPQTHFLHANEFKRAYARNAPKGLVQDVLDAFQSAGRWEELKAAVQASRQTPWRSDTKADIVEEAIDIYLRNRGKTGDDVADDDRAALDIITQMMERETGGKNHFRDLMTKAEGRGISFYPSAFMIGKKLFFNREHPEFTDSVHGKESRDRTVVHELTHYHIDDFQKRGEKFTQTVHSLLKSTGQWNELRAAVDEAFRDGAKETLTTNAAYVHEALSIYLAGKKQPYGNAFPTLQNVFRIIDAMIADPEKNKHLRRLIDELSSDVEKQAPDTIRRFDREMGYDADAEKVITAQNLRHRTREELKAIVAGDNYALHADPTAQRQAAEELEARDGINAEAQEEEVEEERRKKAKKEAADLPPEPTELLDDIKKAQEINANLRGLMKQRIEEQSDKANPTTIAGLQRYLDENDQDLSKAKAWVSDLRDWDGTQERILTAAQKLARATEIGIPGANVYAGVLSDTEMKAADGITRPERGRALINIKKALKEIKKPIEQIEKYADNLNTSDERPQTLWGKFKNLIGPNHVSWITFWDIVKIVHIYKEAVMDNYHARQKVRTYDFAKNFNFYQPIQETLKKQARAANEEETHKYLEYLQKEGMTFQDLFGEDGKSGLLAKVRGNINYFKAVMEYAADHAWLYELQTDLKGEPNGHDVYGVDYINIWGLETFRELVQKNESGKKKEIDLGYERVDKFPDVPGIIDAMVNEIHEKNIFRVQGMMKRLQEKAKFPYSNTWMLVTLLNEMRRYPKLLACFDKGMIDNISNFTITQSTWSVTWLKVLRHDLARWKKNPTDAEFNKNILGQTILEIERLLKEYGGEFPDTPSGHRLKDDAIARVLAAQTVTIKNHHITLFDPKNKIFHEYLKDFASTTNTTPTNPGDTDPDYFNPALGGSDLLLLGSSEIARVLEHQSQGPWVHQNKATNFVTQIFCRDEELGEKSLALQSEFRHQMRIRLVKYFHNVIGQVAGTENLRRQLTSDAKETPAAIRGKFVLDQFVLRNMISDTQAQAIIKQADRFKALKANRDAGWLMGNKHYGDPLAAPIPEPTKADK